MTAPEEQTIVVTGANSFMASHILQEALTRGYNVVGCVRSQSSAEKVKALYPEYEDKLTMVLVPDITTPEPYAVAFEKAKKPVTGVLNLASPFTFKVKDIAGELLEPAVKGALGIMEAVKRYGPSVRRVVTTSSFGSVVDISLGYRPGYTYTEKDWNPMTWEEATKADITTAYCASKALAEKAAWDWMAENKPSFDFATINPPWVFGPRVGGIPDIDHLNESTAILKHLLDAEAVPPIDFAGFADNRVVGKAHLLALETPEAGGERFIIGSRFDYQSAVDAAREQMPEMRDRLPVGEPGAGKKADVYSIDNSKSKRILGVEYIPLEVTIKDSMAELLEAEAKSAVKVN